VAHGEGLDEDRADLFADTKDGLFQALDPPCEGVSLLGHAQANQRLACSDRGRCLAIRTNEHNAKEAEAWEPTTFYGSRRSARCPSS